MAEDRIFVKGARQHNLKDIDVQIPREQLVVVTGLSGSGKSSLAFDTLYAEGQRRYVESLSSYARQFLGQMDKPDVDYIEGLSPSISIDQKSTSHNPRSTVGTVTEIYDYLRLLYARIGHPHCPQCGDPIEAQTIDQMVDQILELPERTRLRLLSPVVRGRKGTHQEVFEEIKESGFVRVRVDGELREISEDIDLDKNVKHRIEVVVDRLIVKDDVRNRLADSLETALTWADGLALVDVVDGSEILFSEHFACVECGISLEELTPRMFSFNSPYGACPECDGLGEKKEIDPGLVMPDRRLSIDEGGVVPWDRGNYYPQLIEAAAEHFGFSTDVPLDDLSDDIIDLILYGSGSEETIRFSYTNRYGRTRTRQVHFEGVVPNLQRRYDEASEGRQRWIEDFMSTSPCPACGGARLRAASRAVTVGGRSIGEVTAMTIRRAYDFIAELELTDREQMIARQVRKEIRERLKFLVDVGLNYLTLSRSAGTLSGGEAQRIRLATQIGSGLVGVLYILDEPSIGLHQRDNARLLDTLEHLRDLGNTLIVVEHDEETIRTADHVIDMGPGAGSRGGEVVAQGDVDDMVDADDSVTGAYLSGREAVAVPQQRRKPQEWVRVHGAQEHNLKQIDVEFPVGCFVCVTGVSGSGKSTLVNETLYKSLAQTLHRGKERPGEHEGIDLPESVRKVVEIDQSPIGRTPRSNPATYTKVFDGIREVFAQTPEANVRGYTRSRFSFNLKGGRCEACKGNGINKIEMHFLPDIYVPCEVCEGQRYNRETLEITYKGKTIADVLDMNVTEALEFFQNVPKIKRRLQTLYDVGLGYIRLGQPSTTLSGGEAQRVKLATELSRRSNGDTVYTLDEPTTGLHMADIDRLLGVLQRLVEEGDTVIIIEHNLDVIKSADHIIDLGPEGGEDGGRVVASGTPEELAAEGRSYTGQFLRLALSDFDAERRQDLDLDTARRALTEEWLTASEDAETEGDETAEEPVEQPAVTSVSAGAD